MIKKADSFIVENPAWTYGRKVVVLQSDYEKLWTEYELTRDALKKERERSAEFQKAAKHARSQIGRIQVVK